MAAEGPSKAEEQLQGKAFTSPEEAVKALVEACRQNDTQGLLALFGPEGKDIVSSGDEVADKTQLSKFVEDYEAKHRLEQGTPGDRHTLCG